MSYDELIAQKLTKYGIQGEHNQIKQSDLVCYARENHLKVPEIVACILECAKDVIVAQGSTWQSNFDSISCYNTCLSWVQWLMFGDEPKKALENLSLWSKDKRAMCDAVWGKGEMAYRCSTCGKYPSCSMCVDCFQNGDHLDHDYIVYYSTCGGCCDCGDINVWDSNGFCLRHKGSNHILPLTDEYSSTMGPALNLLLHNWKISVSLLELHENEDGVHGGLHIKVANEFTSAVVDMLLEFCECSESLLSFIAICSCDCDNFLNVLAQMGRLLETKVVHKIQVLIVKLMREPIFKYEFSKVFVCYYQYTVNKIIEGRGSSLLLEQFPLEATVSGQLFAEAALAERLVREVDLLGFLIKSLDDLLQSSSGKDSRLQVRKHAALLDTSIRLVSDIRVVLSHKAIFTYVVYERANFLCSWIKLLSLLQGMDPQKRLIDLDIEEHYPHIRETFILALHMGKVNSLLVQAAFTCAEFQDFTLLQGLEGVEKHSPQNSSYFPYDGRSSLYSKLSCPTSSLTVSSCKVIPPPAMILIRECIKAIECWMKPLFKSSAVCSKLEQIGYGKLIPSSLVVNSDENPKCTVSDDSVTVWTQFECDVSSHEVSLHIPLHRLLSLLLQTALEKFVNYDIESDHDLPPSWSHTFEFFSLAMGGYKLPYIGSLVMEHPLQLRVFCAQVLAGMWRRNSDAASQNIEWYFSLAWFEQGLESDLFLLQCCAAMAPAEMFVRTVQEKFGLSSYTSLDLAKPHQYESILVQEMLTLIIQIVTERRYLGLSITDALKRELVCKLAVGDATHSQILDSLPDYLSKSDQLQNVLDTLADYSNPSNMKQGKYRLRKTSWNLLDLYYPLWSPASLQLAEENFFQVCKVPARNSQLPRWTNIFSPLNSISNVATSKAVLDILRAVLFYAANTESPSLSRAPDNVLIVALHLISLALNICEVKNQSLVGNFDVDAFQADSKLEAIHYDATEPFPCNEACVTESAISKDHSLLSLLVLLMRKFQGDMGTSGLGAQCCDISTLIKNLLKRFAGLNSDYKSVIRKLAPDAILTPYSSSDGSSSSAASVNQTARERQAAIMEKIRAAQAKFVESQTESDEALDRAESSNDTGTQEKASPVCSLCRESDPMDSLCYYTLLQKSRLVTYIERGNIPWEDNGPTRKSDGGRVDKQAYDNPVALMQLSQHTSVEHPLELDFYEVDAFLDFSTERAPVIQYMKSRNEHYDSSADKIESLEIIEDEVFRSIYEELNGSNTVALIGDKRGLTNHSDKFYSHGSTEHDLSVLGTYVSCLSSNFLEQNDSYNTADHPSNYTFGPYDCDGVHTSTCGHAVHLDCHQRYLLSLKERNWNIEGSQIFYPDQGELYCPVCRRLANSVLPEALSSSGKHSAEVCSVNSTSLLITSDFSESAMRQLQLPVALTVLDIASRKVGERKILKSIAGQNNSSMELALDFFLQKLIILYYPRSYDSMLQSDRLSQSLFLWDTFRYSLISTEIAVRGEMAKEIEPVSNSISLNDMIELPGGFILSKLFGIADCTRIVNCCDVLLRFKGLQLLANSICCGISSDDNFLKGIIHKGSLSNYQQLNSEGVTVDIQFWKQCADPIITKDPFSSLMWALFCLPRPCLSLKELLIPLVHLFYAVCVVQSLITCYCHDNFDASIFCDSLLNDICKAMSEYGLTRQYFTSNYIDHTIHSKDMVRRLTLPYLRRCLLLWKLLRSPVYLNYESSASVDVNSLPCGGVSEDINDYTSELNELHQLEAFFQIGSFEMAIQNESVKELALQWCQHFCEYGSTHAYRGNFFSTPAVPFTLMQLPKLYEGILERFIKIRCPYCGSARSEPALCLLCGKLCSANWNSCCSADNCVDHTSLCTAGISMYLLVRKTSVFLQGPAHVTFMPSPYVDIYGEEDYLIRRGKPLYLNKERYAALTYMMAAHCHDRSTEELRRNTEPIVRRDGDMDD